MGGVIFQMYYGLIESKLFIILTNHISLERPDSQDFIFGYSQHSIFPYFEIGAIMREKCIHLRQKKMHKQIMGFGWHPVAVYGIMPKQNCIVTYIFFISTSNLEHNLFRHMALILCQILIKTYFVKYLFYIYKKKK